VFLVKPVVPPIDRTKKVIKGKQTRPFLFFFCWAHWFSPMFGLFGMKEGMKTMFNKKFIHIVFFFQPSLQTNQGREREKTKRPLFALYPSCPHIDPGGSTGACHE
jgi:hypothetical protein